MEIIALVLTSLTLVGTFTAIVLAFRVVRFLNFHINRSSSLHRYARPNAWCLITGATDGIGLAFAHELASKGMNIVLHGRNPEKMSRVQGELSAAYPEREFRSVLADASNSHGMKKSIENVAGSLDDLSGPLTMLINNCGGSTMSNTYTALADMQPADVDGMINLNLRFAVQLTRAILPRLDKDAPGLILNIGSMAGTSGFPYLTTYAASKAFNNNWSWSLSRELKATGSGIECLGLLVGAVTATAGMQAKESMFGPSAATFVKHALACIGCGRPLVAPHWAHGLQAVVLDLLPEPLQEWFILLNMREVAGVDLSVKSKKT